MHSDAPNRGVPHHSEEALGRNRQAQISFIDDDIKFQHADRRDKVSSGGYIHGNPYEMDSNIPHNGYINPQTVHPEATHQQNPQVIQDGNTLVINGAPPNVIIVNQPAETAKPDPVWTREERYGCCCISVHHESYCCNIFCMDSLCRCVQHANLCCYCHNQDCVHCCVHYACRACCFQKEMCECALECCKHMPICLLFECIKNAGCCEAICGCLQNCNVCEILQGCDCDCVGNILGNICELLCCFFR